MHTIRAYWIVIALTQNQARAQSVKNMSDTNTTQKDQTQTRHKQEYNTVFFVLIQHNNDTRR